jgi:hypothetical protein
MSVSTEPTPPPERPLSDQARSRIRAELLRTARENRSSAPRFLVPAGAAAAVVLVAALSAWAISSGSSEPGSTSVPVAGGGSSSAPPASGPASSSATAASSVPTKPSAPVEVATGTCPEELPNVLPGAEPAFDFPAGGDTGTTSFFVKGDRFVLCDIRDGVTTVQQPMPLSPKGDATTYAVSSLFLGQGNQVVRVGGGVVPDGAADFDVAYTFPDGHVEHATTAADQTGRVWWRMVYTYDDGAGNALDKTPIAVTVSSSDTQQHFTLGWGLYTCAQANHGC